MTNLPNEIKKSLTASHITDGFMSQLLDKKKRIKRRSESDLWDYKKELPLNSPTQKAIFAKNIAGFHNSKGGVLLIGVDDNTWSIRGVPNNLIRDPYELREIITPYLGTHVPIFTDCSPINKDRSLWMIFVKPCDQGSPRAMQIDAYKKGRKVIFTKNTYFMRIGDQTLKCTTPSDLERIFMGRSTATLAAYHYEVDEPYARIFSSHCHRFFGRRELLKTIRQKLTSQWPVLTLIGAGGIGKSEVAIQLTKELYQDKEYQVIISLSAKSRVWTDHIKGRAPGFGGLTELLLEICKVLCIDVHYPINLEEVTTQVREALEGLKALLLIDNLEEIRDQNVFDFLADLPALVKVLVTSRVHQMGGQQITVPPLSDDESRDLFEHELREIGFASTYKEQKSVDEIIKATCGLPLAIRWAAKLAKGRTSLSPVSSRLRSYNSGVSEFLEYCFTTMFDSLSPKARDAALLVPYLGTDWNDDFLKTALCLSKIDVRDAIDELLDKGLIMFVRTPEEEEEEEESAANRVWALPLTMRFLEHRLASNRALKNQVYARFVTILGGEVLSLEKQDRINSVGNVAKSHFQQERYSEALECIEILHHWTKEGKWRFLHGKIRYKLNEYYGGLELMRSVIKNELECLSGDDILFYFRIAEELGTGAHQEEAQRAIISALPSLINFNPTPEEVVRCVELSLSKAITSNDFSKLKLIIHPLRNTPLATKITTKLVRLNSSTKRTIQSEVGTEYLLALLEYAGKELKGKENWYDVTAWKRSIEN